MAAPRTLPSLLRLSLSRLESVYVVQGAGRAGMPSVDLWANLLRVLDRGGADRRELPALTRLSKRAVRSRVSAAARHGWAEELTSGRGQAAIRLTSQGADAAARWELLQQGAERQWQEQVGSGPAAALRALLTSVVADLPLEHPHYPASYGAADASISGGPGQDWKPVPRRSRETADGLTACALLSQSLVAFALEYERLSAVALPVVSAIFQRVPPQGIAVRDLGASVHLSAMQRHGFVRVAGADGDAAVFLTSKGRTVSDAHASRVEAVDQAWRSRSGSETVSSLQQVLETIADQTRD
jgi:hypothetical protein